MTDAVNLAKENNEQEEVEFKILQKISQTYTQTYKTSFQMFKNIHVQPDKY